MKYITIDALLNFLLYAFSSMGLLAVFGLLYQFITPYNEMSQIREGKTAPAIAMGGALLGFTFPVLSVSYHGTNYIDFIIWAAVAGAIQIVTFKILYWIIPMQVEENNCAIAILYAFLAVCVGLINAFSLIPA